VGDAADVVAVGQGEEREHADEDVFQGVDAAHEVAAVSIDRVFYRVRDLQPHAHGFKDLGRQLQVHHPQKLLPRQPPLLVGGNVLGDLEAADISLKGRYLPGLQDFQDFRLFIRLDAGEIIGFDGIDPDVAALQVQALHPPGLGLV
jgi:hypothetical protein